MALVANLDTGHKRVLVPSYNRRSYGVSIASFQRPANETTYANRDVIGTSESAALEFPNSAKVESGSGTVIRAMITMDANLGDLFDLGLYLFDEEPTNHADNTLLVLADADQPFGYLSLADANRLITNAAVDPAGQLTYRSTIDLDQPFVCAEGTRSIYGLLTAETVFTPASAMKVEILLVLEQD